MVGRNLQRYRLVEQVGQGGMSVVYRGLDEALEREVAVKLLHPHLAARPEHRRRLAREAKAVARLQHPNILEIYDFSGEESDQAFLVTELIRGPTLKAFAQQHPFSPPELAAACVHELAGALAHAHAQGIVHRDLKPENVMIQEAAPQPAVKLMDFGIAQIIDRDDRMTVTGSLMGSPAHMAPEIINGEEADERSDIFSLGTILYWLVTGVLPFEAPSPGALLKKVLEGDFTDPRELKPDVSDALAKVIADSLARERAERISSAKELQSRLSACLADAGLERPAELLARFLRQPDDVRRTTRDTIVAHLMRHGDEAAAARKTGKALSAYGRIIAIAPGTPQAGAAREAIDRMKTRVRWKRWAIGSGAVAVSAGVMAVALPHLKSAPVPPVEPPVEVARKPTVPPVEVVPPRPPEPPVEKVDPVVTVAVQKPPLARPPVLPKARDPRTPATVVATPLLTPAPATVMKTVPLTITAWPPSELKIDGHIVDERTRPFQGALPAGPHHIELSRSCCEVWAEDITLDPDRPPIPLDRRLKPLPANVIVHVKNGPPDAIVRIDDKDLGIIGPTGTARTRWGFHKDTNAEEYERDVVIRLYWKGELKAERRQKLVAGGSHELTLEMPPN